MVAIPPAEPGKPVTAPVDAFTVAVSGVEVDHVPPTAVLVSITESLTQAKILPIIGNEVPVMFSIPIGLVAVSEPQNVEGTMYKIVSPPMCEPVMASVMPEGTSVATNGCGFTQVPAAVGDPPIVRVNDPPGQVPSVPFMMPA